MKAVIVADDSIIVKNIVEKAINDEYKVLKASDGREAIKYITDNKEDEIVGILLDLNMPNYNGFHVLNYFKNNNLFGKYPIAIISGDDTKETIEKAFSYSIVDMLNKPFTKDNVKNIINKMIHFKR